MPNLKKILTAYENQTIEFINAFVCWYYTSYNREPYSETLGNTLGRFVSSNPFDCFELSDMYLGLYTVQQAIELSATAEELSDWYHESTVGASDGISSNLRHWLYVKRQKNVTQK